MMQASATAEREAPSARQQAVLDAVLGLMVEDGEQLTMDAVARRASCSKETLYKWFGDRDGLLIATVRWQASRVHAGHDSAQVLNGATLRERLQDFAVTWLEVITGPTSVALNRIAIAHAGSRKSNLGGIVLANGRFAIGERVKPVLEAGRAAGLLTFADSEAAFRTFFGLVGRDIQIRLLLGETLDLDGAEIRRDAGRAVEQFLALYGRAKPDPKHQA
ncbi:TetR/AcrR family transcriptional regulator C-terminal domain-containing protein [Methylobacterium sp. NMS14P]|uniref:TetR/AcrR family transcriptional regulator C-terminal domain-containing protein n=1 Tax=Methylobacterium sp. NMS14P TaxID=2894310 RepID=UPI0023597882|nr:TetR/AcrR family transcriptional regulator C-terminal domain-containing protein [Methylobacterium sp. NMS14P]WCS24898.1 TetR/AcrR family transcriptional regulator C-terminal domain-containing protein [Methylobacterium sp. NMS14P]